MLKPYFVIAVILFVSAFTTIAQEDLPNGEFCYSNPATIYWEFGQSGGVTNLNSFRMFLMEDMGNGWVEVFYQGETGYVLNPDCIDMAELSAEADQIMADATTRLASNPQDHEALAEMARANIMIGEYLRAIDYLEQALALDPTNRFYNTLLATAYRELGWIDALMMSLIPDIPLEDNWYIEGKGTENVVHSFYDDVPLIDHWMILKLATWTYIAVPEGWILSDDIGSSAVALDLAMTDVNSANPTLMLRVVQDFYQGPIHAMPDYLFEILSGWGNASLIDSAILNNDMGYVLIRFEEDAGIMCCWLLAFSRALPSDIDGGWRIFLFSATTQEEWLEYYPLMQGIIANARSHEFIPVGVSLPQNIGVPNAEPSTTTALDWVSTLDNWQTRFVIAGYEAEQSGQYERSYVNYTLALLINPHLTDIRHRRAKALIMLGAYELARADYLIAFAEDERAVYAAANTAYEIRYEQPRTAIELLTIAIEGLPTAANFYMMRAELYQNIGEDNLALADYDQAIRINPAYSEAQIARGRLYVKLGEYELALADYDAFISRYDLPREVLERGRLYYRLGDCESAMNDFTYIIEDNGTLSSGFWSDALAMRGLCQMDLGNYELAIEDLLRAIEENRYNDEAYLYLGRVYHTQGRYEEAIENYNSCLTAASTYGGSGFECVRNRALSLRELGRYDEAVSDLLAVIKEQPNQSDLRAELGDTYFIMGELTLMVEQYREYERITGSLEPYMQQRINEVVN
jgi:tetratricopeptide (TPR) repeat protein